MAAWQRREIVRRCHSAICFREGRDHIGNGHRLRRSFHPGGVAGISRGLKHDAQDVLVVEQESADFRQFVVVDS